MQKQFKNKNADLFSKWWETKGLAEIKEKGLLEGVPDAVEIARLAYNNGLYTSPAALLPIGKDETYAKSHFIKCDCGCQQLECEVFNYRNGDNGVNFTIWSRGREGKGIWSWREKIRWCWNILKTGRPWADDIIATNKEAHGLAKFILQNVPIEQTHEETKQ